MLNEELARSDLHVREESQTASIKTQLKRVISNKLIYLKFNRYEIIKLQHAQAASRSTQSRKLSYHTDLL